MKITKKELAKIVAEETTGYFREGRLISKNITDGLVDQMNKMADVLNQFDPSAVDEQTAEVLNAAQQALNSALETTFGDMLAAPVKQAMPSTLQEGCGDLSDEPMPLPGPPPEAHDVGMHTIEPAYDDHEGKMAKSQLYKMSKYSEELMGMLGDQDQLPSWVQAKIAKAADYIGAVKHHLEYERVTAQQINERFEKEIF
jgi:hypothetical protein